MILARLYVRGSSCEAMLLATLKEMEPQQVFLRETQHVVVAIRNRGAILYMNLLSLMLMVAHNVCGEAKGHLRSRQAAHNTLQALVDLGQDFVGVGGIVYFKAFQPGRLSYPQVSVMRGHVQEALGQKSFLKGSMFQVHGGPLALAEMPFPASSMPQGQDK